MNVTLTLNDELVNKIRKIAVDRDTTLTGLVRSYLETVASERDALDRSFARFQFNVGQQTWKRADLYDRV